MANIAITSEAWTVMPITSGTVQNISATATIELSSEQTDNSGICLAPGELYGWDSKTIYARSVTEDVNAAVRVVNFKRSAGGGGGSYVLPIASANELGGVKIGNNVSIDANGVLSATDTVYTLPTAAANTLGGIKIGSGLTIDENGVLSATGGGGGGDPIGRVVFDVVLRDGYVKANGAAVSDASTSLPNLLAFVQDNPSLLAADAAAYAANVGLYLYDSDTDELTLPNYIGRFVEGGNSIASVEPGLPNIKGTTNYSNGCGLISVETTSTGAFGILNDGASTQTWDGSAPSGGGRVLTFDASKSNSIYSDSVITVQPPAIALIPQIKY